MGQAKRDKGLKRTLKRFEKYNRALGWAVRGRGYRPYQNAPYTIKDGLIYGDIPQARVDVHFGIITGRENDAAGRS